MRGTDLQKGEGRSQRSIDQKTSNKSRGSQRATVSQLGSGQTHTGPVLIQRPLMTCERLLPAPS